MADDLDKLHSEFAARGLLRGVDVQQIGDGLWLARALARSRSREREYQGSALRANREHAEVVSVLEAVERHACSSAAVELRCGSYADLSRGAVRVIDPVDLGVHLAEQYASDRPPGLHEWGTFTPYSRYSLDVDMRWVTAWSLTRAEPVFVAEPFVYFDSPWPRYVCETSSGGAVGFSMEEAALRGLFEVLERDAFLLAWAKLDPLPRVRVEDYAEDDEVRRLVASLAGREVGLYMTLSAALTPVVWATARGVPALVCGLGASSDLRTSARCALRELLASTVSRPVGAVDEVRSLDDHALRVSLDVPEHVRLYLDSLRDADTKKLSRWCCEGLDLVSLAVTLKANGWEVIVADVTTNELRSFGLCAAKVIVPGLLPLTFGEQNHRAPRHRRLRVEDVKNNEPHPLA